LKTRSPGLKGARGAAGPGPFQPDARCAECLMKLSRDVSATAAPNDHTLQEAMVFKARRFIREARDAGLSSPETANRILRMIRERTGVHDPFRSFKRLEMRHAREAYSRLRPRFDGNLRSLASLAALGNSLDFFRDPKEAFDELPPHLEGGVPFHHDDLDRLEEALGEGLGLVLYLTDNAGEIFFDRPLYEEIRRRAKRTVLVVKGGPGLNDLTRDELEAEGLAGAFQEVADTGTDGAGVDWRCASDAFHRLLARADLVLSKGMANFETLLDRDLQAAVLYLFKVKCEPIREHLNAPAESYWALWRDGHKVTGDRETSPHEASAPECCSTAGQGEKTP